MNNKNNKKAMSQMWWVIIGVIIAIIVLITTIYIYTTYMKKGTKNIDQTQEGSLDSMGFKCMTKNDCNNEGGTTTTIPCSIQGCEENCYRCIKN